MRWIVARMKWIMLVSGVLTCTPIRAFFAPDTTLRAMFGVTLQGPVAEIVVRNWGLLIALMGALLIYGAFKPAYRPVLLVIAGLNKLVFIGLALSYGSAFLDHQVGISVAADSVMVMLFACYLLADRHPAPAA
jgi:hypothetical protein